METVEEKGSITNKFYVIGTTPRSGSNMLCDLLSSSRVMGNPSEFLNPKGSLIPLVKKYNLFDSQGRVSLSSYLSYMIEQRSTENNCFGLKLLFDQLDIFIEYDTVKQFLKQCNFIWLVRQDVIAQAVSLYIATETDSWKSFEQEKKSRDQVEYNEEQISYFLDLIIHQNAKWEEFFLTNQIDYLKVTYEELLQKPRQICIKICQFCGVETEHKFLIKTVKFKKQGDSLNEKFAENFRNNSRMNLNLERKNYSRHIQEFQIVNQEKHADNNVESDLSLLERSELSKLDLENINTASQKYYEDAQVMVAENKFSDAVVSYQKLIEIKPDFGEAYIGLGDAFVSLGNLDEAIVNYIKAAQIELKWGLPYVRLKRLLNSPHILPAQVEKINQFSVDTFQQIPRHKQVKSIVINSLSFLGRVNEAISFCEKITYQNNQEKKPDFVSQYWQSGITSKKPNFIIIGFMKCGTTSLYHYLVQHPQVLPASQKEIMFFSNDKLFRLGVDWYKSNFPPIPDDSGYITGEASTLYVMSELYAKRVWESIPDTKLIVLLRNPVARSVSHYYFNQKTLGRNKSLEQIVNAEIKDINQQQNIGDWIDGKQGLVFTGLYFYFLEKWLGIFPKQQFLILTMEGLVQTPQSVMDRVFDFLGLPEYQIPDFPQKNSTDYPGVRDEIRTSLSSFYKSHNHKLEELLNANFDW